MLTLQGNGIIHQNILKRLDSDWTRYDSKLTKTKLLGFFLCCQRPVTGFSTRQTFYFLLHLKRYNRPDRKLRILYNGFALGTPVFPPILSR